jgi:hypothetical protein
MNASISAPVGLGLKARNVPADVRVVQELLNGVGEAEGGPKVGLKVDGICGSKTTGAIQQFQLKHFGWKLADGRVDPNGPTLAKLNQLSKGTTIIPGVGVCVLVSASPIDVAGPVALRAVAFVPSAAATDNEVMGRAFQESRRTLRLARNALANLQQGFANEKQGKPLTDFQKRVLLSVSRWLKVARSDTPTARAQAGIVVQRAINLMDRNLNVKTSTRGDPPLRRVSDNFHAAVDGNPDNGVNCGELFFTVDGPNCRRDVMTHECFHFVGIHHAGGPVMGPTVRSRIVTSDQALDSADNLAQLVAEIMNGRTDACTRPND